MKNYTTYITINAESVRCEVAAHREDNPHIALGEVLYSAGQSRYSLDGCDFALVYVEVPDEDGEKMCLELYAECSPDDVPGEGHYENEDGICGRDDYGAEWIYDDEGASEKFLLLALE